MSILLYEIVKITLQKILLVNKFFKIVCKLQLFWKNKYINLL